MNTIDLFKDLSERFKVEASKTMKVKASLIVMSHLSDAQESNIKPNSDLNINFAKFIILQCKGDLNLLIDGDEMWEKYLNRRG